MAIKPNDNDVLSGRGAWFNQHPGNEHFRRMLEEQKVSEPQLLCPRLPVEAVYYNHNRRLFIIILCLKGCLRGRHEEAKDGHVQGHR